ncbi:MAG: protein kinase [Promethearchaeota archaeon]
MINNEKISGRIYRIGDVIGNEYKVYNILGGEGRSGMGIVYVCVDLETKYIYALKTIQKRLLVSKNIINSFKNEAMAWISLGLHPNIVIAESVKNLDENLFIILNFIPTDYFGRNTLTHYLQTPISLRQSLNWGIQFCFGMEYATSKGVFPHRDIKPDNIMIDPDKVLKITDFGLAKVFADVDIKKKRKILGRKDASKFCFIDDTRDGMVGTPPWMAPEQFEGHADLRSDIYSFGIVLYQMVNNGKPPFIANTIEGFYNAHKNKAIPPLETKLFPILNKCLCKNPNDRYQNFEDLRIDLEEIYQSETGEKIPKPSELQEGNKDFERAVIFNKAGSFANIGLYDDALKIYKDLLKTNPNDISVIYNMGVVLFEKGDFKKSNSMFKKVLEFDSALPFEKKIKIYTEIGVNFMSMNSNNEALKYFKEALNIDQYNIKALAYMAEILRQSGELDKAETILNDALKSMPNNAELYIELSKVYIYKDLISKAIEMCQKAKTLDPNNAKIYFLLGAIYGKTKQYRRLDDREKSPYEDAIKELKKAIEINPRYVYAYFSLASFYYEDSQYMNAFRTLQQCLIVEPNYKEAEFRLNQLIQEGYIKFTCRVCGTRHTQLLTHCAKCRVKMNADDKVERKAREEKNLCLKCEWVLKPDAKFCQNCGLSRDELNKRYDLLEEKRKKEKELETKKEKAKDLLFQQFTKGSENSK